jgi:hypothetical protein
MAKETIVVLRDDIDGTIIEEGQGETVRFSVNNTSYVIDLSTQNAVAFRDAIKPYIDAAAKEVSSLPRTSSSAPKSNKEDLMKIRLWARENGYNVSGRGRVSQEIQDAFHAANG